MLFSHSGTFEGARNDPWVCSAEVSIQARAMQKCNKIRGAKILKNWTEGFIDAHVQHCVSRKSRHGNHST